MYSIKKIDGKDGVSIATEFDKFKDILFNKKLIRYKMKRVQSKKHKLGTYDLTSIFIMFRQQKICVRWWNVYFKLFSQK